MSTLQRLIINGRLVLETGIEKGDILIDGEQISEVGPGLFEKITGLSRSSSTNREFRAKEVKTGHDAAVTDAAGCLVMPGMIDAHTHYHLVSRGTVTADSFFEGSRLAAFGGVTTIVDFADHDKSQELSVSTKKRIDAMSNDIAVDFALHQGVYGVPDTLFAQLESVKALGVRAVKIFTTYKQVGYLIETSKLRELFEYCRKLELLVTVHAEDDPLIEELAEKQGDAYAGPEMHPKLRPAEAEYRAVSYICALAKEVGIPIYIVHLSSAKGLQAVREARESGADVHVETTPHYLLLENSLLSLPDAPKYVMTPPLREKKDNTALWEAVAGNEIAVIATDHCAFTEEQKLSSQDCRSIFPGIPGTEEMLPLIHTHGVVKGLFDLQRMTDLLSRNPAEIFGLYPQKGSLHPGSDADIIVFDPEEEWTICKETEHTKAGYTPYEGSRVTGKVKRTFLRGELLVSDNEYFGRKGTGHFLKASPSSVWSKIKP